MAKANIEGNVKAESLEVSGKIQAKTLDLEGAFTALKSIGGGFSISDPVNVGLELGRRDGTPGTPYIDFHTDGQANTDYNARIIAHSNYLDIASAGGLKINGNSVDALMMAMMGNNWSAFSTYGKVTKLVDGNIASGNIGIGAPLLNYDIIFVCGTEDNNNGTTWTCIPVWQLSEALTQNPNGNTALWFNSQAFWYVKNSSFNTTTLTVFSECAKIYKIIGVKL